jgi:hypothetical protein
MSESQGLFLSSLRIDGVRAIRSLEIKGLGRVNLFVGANNAGKTSLLEALRLYAAQGIPQAFRDILQVRGNAFSTDVSGSLEEWGILMEAVQSIFHGGLTQQEGLSLQVGPVDGRGQTLTIKLEWGRTDPQNSSRLAFAVPTPALLVDYGGEQIGEVLVTRLVVPPHPSIENQVPFAVYVPPCGVGEDRLGAMWDRITLTEWEAAILEALKLIVPRLEGLSFVVEGGRRRVPVAKLQDIANPIPLRNMGDGVNRLLSIALAMVNARGGFLLVDEFENGLYYGVQAEVWEVVFRLAERLNVQVFATTHSWDCIVAFQYAANQSLTRGMLYRLNREDDDRVFTTAYTEKEVAIAAEQQIEVR